MRHCPGATTSSAQQPNSRTANKVHRCHLACGLSMSSSKSRDGDACLHRCSREAGVWPCTTTVDDLKHGEHATAQGSRLVPPALPLALKAADSTHCVRKPLACRIQLHIHSRKRSIETWLIGSSAPCTPSMRSSLPATPII